MGTARAESIRSEILDAPLVIVSSPPFFLDRTFIDPTTGNAGSSEHAIIDLPNMEMKGLTQAGPRGSATLFDSISDTLHWQGLPTGGLPVTYRLIADGTGFIPSSIPGIGPAQIDEVLGLRMAIGPGGGTGNPNPDFAFTNVPNAPGSVTPDMTFPIHEEASLTRTEVNGPVSMLLSLRLASIEGSSFDFLNTVKLVIDLPPGSSVTSDGGFFQASAVPEPSSLVLIAAGASVALLAHLARRRV
jgi:hypothetical protein